MIRSKELHSELREVVADGVGGAMLISSKGAILASAGFEHFEPKIVSAISAHVWAHVALVPTKYPQVGDLRTMARAPSLALPRRLPRLFALARAPARAAAARALPTGPRPSQLFDVEGGTFVLGELFEASHFARRSAPSTRATRDVANAPQVCLYSKKEYGEPLSELFGAFPPPARRAHLRFGDGAPPPAARLAALQQKLVEMCGDALSGRPDDATAPGDGPEPPTAAAGSGTTLGSDVG